MYKVEYMILISTGEWVACELNNSGYGFNIMDATDKVEKMAGSENIKGARVVRL